MEDPASSRSQGDVFAPVAPQADVPRRSRTVDFLPADIVRHRFASWRGVQIETIQLISHDRFLYSFKHHQHLLVAIEHGARYDGEITVEGLPRSNLRRCSHKLILIPAGRRFFGWVHPRELTRSICIYIDPGMVAVDPDRRFDEAALEARMLFDDTDLWQTIGKLKNQIDGQDPSNRLYAEALGGVLAHELLRLHGKAPARPRHRGGLAAWQQKRIIDFMDAHVAENLSLHTLASQVRLSPYHFVRAFKQSFGAPPHRYWTDRRVERAKSLLADPRASVTQIALDLGFSSTSVFGATFRRVTGETPTDYRRSLA
jgi:AraC family transcriptional regulator